MGALLLRFWGVPNPSKSDEEFVKHVGRFHMTLGIDFQWILERFWRQVGSQNGAKIDTKGGWENDEKMLMTRMAKQSCSWKTETD